MKKRSRFNLIDLLIVLLIFVSFAVAIPMFSSGEKQTCEIAYTVSFSDMDEEYLDNVKVGDTVLDPISKRVLGTVGAVVRDGNDVNVVVTADAVYKEDNAVNINSQTLTVGETASFRFPDYVGEGSITALKRVE